MTNAKRKHRATGKARGGARPGAGSHSGPNVLGQGELKAIRALKWRVPEEAPAELADVAGEAFEALVSVMRGEVGGFEAGPILKAATLVRTEVCGPATQKVEHSFGAMTDEQLEARFRALTGKPDGEPE